MGSKQDSNEKEICGIVMPISPIENCDETHWSEVLEIISDAITMAGFDANLVSSSEDIGVIQKRIIQNLYENPIVVCDVSAKNANVMFELGLRLAFDKPTIIIKDDKTSYSFDTSPIEHLEYPRDLRFSTIVDFKKNLKNRIIKTHQKATEDQNFTSFLGHFGTFTIAKLDQKEVSENDFIINQIDEIKQMLKSQHLRSFSPRLREAHTTIDWSQISQFSKDAKKAIRKYVRETGISRTDIKVENTELLSFVEEYANARAYFKKRAEYEEAMRILLAINY